MKKPDIRWEQRFSNYKKALDKLKEAVANSRIRDLTDLEKEGLIQRFEYTHELAWNVMKDYFDFQGVNNITGSRDAIREAFDKGLIDDGKTWMDMIISRNKTSHTYNEETAEKIVEDVISRYTACFLDFEKKMDGLRDRENQYQ